MDLASFDKRRYPVVSVQTGYGEWAGHYEATVAAGLDGPMLDALKSVVWNKVPTAADLACDTGRTALWLRQHGVRVIDDVDITREMIEIAKTKGVYHHLQIADAAATGLAASSYDLCILVLADEHLARLQPVYLEAARLLASNGNFILLGYHPFFLMNGMPTHYHRPNGEAVTIRSYVHLFSEHYRAACDAGLSLIEFQETVIEEDWLRTRPKWRNYLRWPVSFASIWHRG